MAKLVLCIDRDNDLEKKANIKGPLIGKQQCLNAAIKLALKDPEDSDVNAIFYALKVYNELKEKKEVAILTGHEKLGIKADLKIAEQLEQILAKNPELKEAILITDGMEDEQVIPIIQSKITIVAKHIVTVKQLKHAESTYYMLIEAMKKTGLPKLLIGLPGLALIFYSIMAYLNALQYFYIVTAAVFGTYLFFKGFYLDEKITRYLTILKESITKLKISMPFYLAFIFFIFYGLFASITNYFLSRKAFVDVMLSLQTFLFYFFVSFSMLLVARSLDVFQEKKAYKLYNYVVLFFIAFFAWLLLDIAILITINYAKLEHFALFLAISFISIAYITKLFEPLSLKKFVSPIFVGLEAFDEKGLYLGTVSAIDENKNLLKIKTKKGFVLAPIEKVEITKDGTLIVHQ